MRLIAESILNIFKLWFLWNKKYKIKLISMVCSIFIMFISLLTYIIHTKSLNELDPILLDIDTNTLIGKIVASKLFKISSKFLFSYWNFGSSYETLFGLIALSFSLILVLIIISSYIKIIIIPLTMITSFVFYDLLMILKNQYYIENTIEIFDRFGIKLFKSPEGPKPFDTKEIWENINLLKLAFDDGAKSNNKICDWTNVDLDQLHDMILMQKLSEWKDLNANITKYFKENVIISDIGVFTNFMENIGNYGSIATNKLISLTSNEIFIVGVGIIAIIYLYILIGSVHNEAKVIHETTVSLQTEAKALNDLSNSNFKFAQGINEKTNTMSGHISEIDTSLQSTIEKLGQTNTNVNELAETCEMQSNNVKKLFSELLGVDSFKEDQMPIKLSDLVENICKLDDRTEALAQQIKLINEFIQNLKNQK